MPANERKKRGINAKRLTQSLPLGRSKKSTAAAGIFERNYNSQHSDPNPRYENSIDGSEGDFEGVHPVREGMPGGGGAQKKGFTKGLKNKLNAVTFIAGTHGGGFNSHSPAAAAKEGSAHSGAHGGEGTERAYGGIPSSSYGNDGNYGDGNFESYNEAEGNLGMNGMNHHPTTPSGGGAAGAFSPAATAGMVPQTISASAGVHRLNRILDQTPQSRVSYVPEYDDGNKITPRTSNVNGLGGMGVGDKRTSFTNAVKSFANDLAGGGAWDHSGHADALGGAGSGGEWLGPGPPPSNPKPKPEELKVSDPSDEDAVGDMVCLAAPRLDVDFRSIGGYKLNTSDVVGEDTNILLKDNNTSGKQQHNKLTFRRGKNKAGEGGQVMNKKELMLSKLSNECLLCVRVGKFEISGGNNNNANEGAVGPGGLANSSGVSTINLGANSKTGKHRGIAGVTKARNKLRFVCVIRSTNRHLLKRNKKGTSNEDKKQFKNQGEENRMEDTDEDDDDSDHGYDKMFSPESDEDDDIIDGNKKKNAKKKKKAEAAPDSTSTSENQKTNKQKDNEKGSKGNDENTMSPEDEISSFPALICLALHSDGTNPDLRRIVSLDQLVTVDSRNDGTVQLMFRTGDAIEIDCSVGGNTPASSGNNAAGEGKDDNVVTPAGGSTKTRKERFLWSLLQIHAILCTSVIERTSGYGLGSTKGVPSSSSLPPVQLIVRNIDRADLQYVSTVNGFLSDSPVLMALLDRQRKGSGSKSRDKGRVGENGENGDKSTAAGVEGEMAKLSINQADEMDGMAYDMMMGNFTRYAIFASDEERNDAEEVLNAISWQQQEITSEGMTNVDAAATAETLAKMLQKRMRDLEAETCRRLIAWEDEKHYSMSGAALKTNVPTRDTLDALSLATLFSMLDELDEELEKMEEWLEDKAAAIKPLTDDCRDIEEENRQLEQQWKSYEMLGSELRRLLSGLEVPKHLESVISNPGSILSYDPSGAIDVERSEDGVDLIHEAGQALKAAMDRVTQEGGVHLFAVSDRVKGLATMSGMFCSALAQIAVTVMEQLAADVSNSEQGKVAKSDSHTVVAKKIRDTQRRYQSSLLSYIKLIEVLALLKPSILPAIRDAYSELVAEVIMNKKRMKGYFSTLPGKTSKTMESVTNDLKEYSVVTLRSDKPAEVGSANMKPVNMQDIQSALSEMLPVIAREAYFTAALFGLSTRHADGREKKRNFESAKRSVDHSSQYFRYYMSRICGIASEADAEGKKVNGDPMLSLVASIHLNEAMDGYIDRQKKGGDHSLSLAYVRATILDLRKKVDKQWAAWVDDQIKWIKTNPGVPPNGKRAGIFTSFARFPCYLDHVMTCCKSGRSKEYTPKLAKIKVVSYYLQKMAGALFTSLQQCAERETTDKQYAANVMRMENSYFFTQSIKQRGPEMTTLFAKQITAASSICKQSTDAYLGWMIKREFKALHSLFSNISRIRRDVGDADVPIHVPRATFVKTLQKESNRDVMKEKIGIIYARMEKHLSEGGGLLPVAWKALVKVLYEWFGRWEKLSTQCYKFNLEPSAVDVVRIAKAAGGSVTRMALTREKGSQNASFNNNNSRQASGRNRLAGRRLEAEC